MWAALIILAHIFGPPQAGGQQDFELCTGKTKSTREESIAACHRVTFKEVLDKKSIGKAYLLLARWADKPAGAISYLDQAIAQDPENGDYYGERGFQYHLLGDYDRALSEHETALALNPDSSYTYGVRAFTLEQKGDDAGALADLDRAIAIEPQEYAFYTSKADIYLRQGDTSAALAALDQGLKFNPDRVEIYSAKAEIYRKIGDAKGELAALNRLIEFKPGETGLLHRALTYERLGRLDLAIADYDALLALDPRRQVLPRTPRGVAQGERRGRGASGTSRGRRRCAGQKQGARPWCGALEESRPERGAGARVPRLRARRRSDGLRPLRKVTSPAGPAHDKSAKTGGRIGHCPSQGVSGLLESRSEAQVLAEPVRGGLRGALSLDRVR